MLKATLSAKEEFVSRHNVCGETENLREERREGGREGEDTDVRRRVATTPQMSLILVLHNTPVVAIAAQALAAVSQRPPGAPATPNPKVS